MIIYHGTLTQFNNIDISRGKGYKDFGKGFYCASNIEHSRALVNRNRRGTQQTGVIYCYQFELSAFQGLNVKIFNAATVEWFDFVLNNRKYNKTVHSYDLVIGPTADDSTNQVLRAYMDGVYGDVDSQLAKQTAVNLLLTYKLSTQYFFGTNKAIKILESNPRRCLYI